LGKFKLRPLIPLTIIPLTFRSVDEKWFRATLVSKAELSFRTPRRWRVQGALTHGRKVLERGAPAPLFKAPSRHEQAKKGGKAWSGSISSAPRPILPCTDQTGTNFADDVCLIVA
jgi:hypothetical protein